MYVLLISPAQVSVVLIDFSVTVYVNEQNFGFEGAFLKA